MSNRTKEQEQNALSEVASLVAERLKESSQDSVPKSVEQSGAHPKHTISDEERARLQAAQEKIQREQEIKKKQEEQEKRRTQAAEQTAHQEGHAWVDEFRHHAQSEALSREPFPWIFTFILTLSLLGLGTAFLYWFHGSQNRKLTETNKEQAAELNRLKGQNNEQIETSRNKYKEEVFVLQERVHVLEKELTSKQSEINALAQKKETLEKEQKAKIEKAQKLEELYNKNYERIKAEKEAAEKKRTAKIKELDQKYKKCKDSDDPLCGL